MSYQPIMIPADTVKDGDLTALGDTIYDVVVSRKYVRFRAAGVPRKYEKDAMITVLRQGGA